MNKNDRFWSGKYWRYLLFVEKRGNKYIFEDFGDKRFALSETDLEKLERR